MKFPGCETNIRICLIGTASRRRMSCHLLAALLMAVVASPMAGTALQMQGPAVLTSIFGAESESEEDTSTDASDYGDLLSRPRDRSRRHDVRLMRLPVSDRTDRRLTRLSQANAQSAAEDVRLSRETPRRC